MCFNELINRYLLKGEKLKKYFLLFFSKKNAAFFPKLFSPTSNMGENNKQSLIL